ncbi:MAG: hypothetical protein H8D97_01065 [Proteobacteria bacterium]|nr:hypothetical protein [Pseudomonadota bacterium]
MKVIDYANRLIEEGIVDAFTAGRDNDRKFNANNANAYERAAHSVGKNVVRNISAISKRFVSDKTREDRRARFKTKAAQHLAKRKANTEIKKHFPQKG